MPLIDLPVPVITIISEGDSTAGENYTLTCSASVIEGLIPDAVVSLSWADIRGDPIQRSFMQTSGINTTSALHFSPLLLSHGGQYVCNASITISAISTVKQNSQPYDIITQSKACWYICAVQLVKLLSYF